MPFYTFRCEECDHHFDVRATIREKEAGLKPGCPQCKGEQTHQIITAGVTLHGSGISEFARPGCSPSAGPGCCG